MNDFSTIEETLDKYGSFIIAPVGISMLPLLRWGKDTVVIERLKRPPQKHDMILYKRNNGQYVLHRLLEIRKRDYVMCGDNQFIREYGITDENIIGICTGIYRKEKYVSCQNPLYRLYVRFWCFSIPLRRVMLFSINFARCVKNYLAVRLKKIRASKFFAKKMLNRDK